jgi:hypothetical protein
MTQTLPRTRAGRDCLITAHLSGPCSGCGAPCEELHLAESGGSAAVHAARSDGSKSGHAWRVAGATGKEHRK